MSNRSSNTLTSGDSPISSIDITSDSPSTITTDSPKQNGRPWDYIWSHFNDMGPAKTPGHRKAQCKYCLLSLNFAKLSIMCSHIAHHCDEIVNYNPNARKETIV